MGSTFRKKMARTSIQSKESKKILRRNKYASGGFRRAGHILTIRVIYLQSIKIYIHIYMMHKVFLLVRF